jgi:solute carrier family 35 protein E1
MPELYSAHRVFVPEPLRAHAYPASAPGMPMHVPEASFVPEPEHIPAAAQRIGYANSLSEVSLNDAAGLITGLSAAPVLVVLALYGVGRPLVKRARRVKRDVEMDGNRSPRDVEMRSPTDVEMIATAPAARRQQVTRELVEEEDEDDDFLIYDKSDNLAERRRAAFEVVKTGSFFALWYFFNTANNVFNKRALTALPLPWTAATVALASGIPYVSFLWATGLRPMPKLSLEHVKNLSGICAAHLCAHVGGTIAIGAGAVSFIQIVKASEPVVSCILSASFLGQVYSMPIYATLLPIVGGVALSSVSELSFTWLAFGSAMLSNVAGSFRGILAKKAMGKPQGENMTDANLYAVLTIMSFCALLPVSLMVEPPAKIAATWAAANAAGIGSGYIIFNLLTAGICYYLYNETSFLALGRVSPVTHAVANTVKRIVIILVSVGIFSTKMTPLGMAGSGIAVAGAFFYAIAKQFSERPR